MYIYYTKFEDKVLVQNNNMNIEIFDNTNTIDDILKIKNNIEFIQRKKKKLSLIKDENLKEETYIKSLYLDSLEKIELKRLEKLSNKSIKAYTKNKLSNYVTNNYIQDLNNKLKLIDLYLYIRDSIINHKELNITFDETENNRKKLKFVNLCFENIKTPENFIDSLIKKDGLYSINNKQKKLI